LATFFTALAPFVDLAGAFEAVVGVLKVGSRALKGGKLEDGRLRGIETHWK
jgi:hypothetical protein